MLSVKNVEAMFHRTILVLQSVSIAVKDEEIVCLLGGNGAGKSTLLKAITAMLKAEDGEITSGSIEFEGKRIDRFNTETIARMGVIGIMEGHPVLEQLSTEENLKMGFYMRHDVVNFKKALESVYNYFPQLRGVRKKTSGYLSGGEQQMLVLGRGLMSKPKLMLIDEPSLGLAPLLVKEIFSIIERIYENEKLPFLIVEQNAKAALRISHTSYVMENGRIVLEDKARSLLENEDIKQYYLGISTGGKKRDFKNVKHYRKTKRWAYRVS